MSAPGAPPRLLACQNEIDTITDASGWRDCGSDIGPSCLHVDLDFDFFDHDGTTDTLVRSSARRDNVELGLA